MPINEPVYNLHITHEAHNYFVQNILAHNRKTEEQSVRSTANQSSTNNKMTFIPMSNKPESQATQHIHVYIGNEKLEEYVYGTINNALK
jgi:hypothetical protein